VPGPQLTFNQGDVVTINLHNDLSVDTALLFQGQSMLPDLTGVSNGGTQSYTFTVDKPGTFLYEAGLAPGFQIQVAMGMYGAMVVRPAGAPSQAYASSSSAFDSEEVLVLSELDPTLNNSGNPTAFDIRRFSPKYYLINGKAYPDTDALTVGAGSTVLLRYVNAGLQAHSMSTLGLSQKIIGQDGHANLYGRAVVAETIATGQTLDTLVSIPATAGAQYPVYDASLFLRNSDGTGSSSGLGGMLTMLNAGSVTPPADTAGPRATALGLSPNPADGTVDVTVSASLSDVASGNSDIAAAEFYIDDTLGTPTAMTGAFSSPTDSVSGTILAATVAGLTPGAHTIHVRGQDSAGNWGAFASITLTVGATTPAPTGDALDFSTTGITASGPDGVGSDGGDIYHFDGLPFSLGIDAPAGTSVDGFDMVDGDHFYMSFSAEVTVGSVTVQKEDVAYFDAGAWSVFFDGTANGLGGSNVDAISVVGSELYFSTSDTALPGSVAGPGDDADIYHWDGASTFARVFDATALGWSGHNVDGLAWVDSTHFYLSYSPTSTVVAGLGIVQDEDVVYYNNGVWFLYFDGTSKGLTSTALDADAFDVP
jgi:FtsP/CotA-like multicopper oxidase with cupredoxin domain